MKQSILSSLKIWLDFFFKKKSENVFQSQFSLLAFNELNTKGFFKFNIFDECNAEFLKEEKEYFKNIHSHFNDFRKNFTDPSDLLNPVARKQYQIRASVTEHFHRYVNDLKKINQIKFFKEILSNFFKNDLLNFQNDFWVSFNNKNDLTNLKRTASQNWHSDPEYYKVIKIFFYFNDIDQSKGPTDYIPETFIGGKKNKFLLRLKNFPHISSYYSDKFINFLYNKNYFSSLGKFGDIFIFNSTGVHRGGYVLKGERQLAIFSFTSKKSPYINSNYL
jgi:hypothetical protein